MTESRDTDTSAGYVDINLLVLLRYLVQSWRFILISVLVALVFNTCSLRDASPTY